MDTQEVEESSPRCWCCWLTKSDPITTWKNPLIRACTGCKDLDLQYVHVDCMNRYITNLIQLRQPYEHLADIPFIPHGAIKGILDQLGSEAKTTTTTAAAIYHHHPPCRHGIIGGLQSPLALAGNHADDGNRAGWIHADDDHRRSRSECTCPRYDRLDGLRLHCSRCLDPYVAVARRVSSLRVLFHDRVLRLLVAMMTVCIVVLVGATSLLILAPHIDNDHRPLTIRPWWNAEPMDARQWAGIIMAIFVSIYLATVAAVLYHSSGYREIMVLPKKVVQLEGEPRSVVAWTDTTTMYST